MSAIQNKYDIVMLFDIKNGNPNGDPDCGNMPRQFDDGSNLGFVTDVCLKRKIRDTIMKAVKAGVLPADGNDIYIRGGDTLDARDVACIKDSGVLDDDELKDLKASLKNIQNTEKDVALHDFVCKRYYDVRTFGAVMTMMADTRFSRNVRGPVQFTMAESVDPIQPESVSISRCAVTKEADRVKQSTFGDKWIVPYGLYRYNIHISAMQAADTGFSDEDLETFLLALQHMFDDDSAAARGEVNVRKIVVFKHESAWGNAPFATLANAVYVCKADDVDVPHNYSDYFVKINRDMIPEGVEVRELV